MSLVSLERRILERFRAGLTQEGGPADEDGWVTFLLHAVLESMRRLRAASHHQALPDFKGDGTPTIPVEGEIEAQFRHALDRFAPGAAFVGEESGGRMAPEGWTVAVDPIDGTWAYLGHTETSATVFTLFRAGQPQLAVLGNHRVGEIGYCMEGGVTRLLQLGLLGEGDTGEDLPMRVSNPDTILVNVQPARSRAREVGALLGAAAKRELALVRSPGGSPSWALLEAARGHFTYVNFWERHAAAPWDLAGGVLLVRGAGGEVVDLDGEPIDPIGHEGLFVADVHPERREHVLQILRRGTGT